MLVIRRCSTCGGSGKLRGHSFRDGFFTIPCNECNGFGKILEPDPELGKLEGDHKDKAGGDSCP
jgi:DnaJ-class molecular chaperone